MTIRTLKICGFCNQLINYTKDYLITLCGHYFHTDCFLSYLHEPDYNKKCPSCNCLIDDTTIQQLLLENQTYKYMSIILNSCEETEESKYNLDCPVCLEPLDLNNNYIVTSCNHEFHYSCIIKYLYNFSYNDRTNLGCPLCRNKFFDKLNIYISDDDSDIDIDQFTVNSQFSDEINEYIDLLEENDF